MTKYYKKGCEMEFMEALRRLAPGPIDLKAETKRKPCQEETIIEALNRIAAEPIDLEAETKRAHHVMSGYREDMAKLEEENAILVETVERFACKGYQSAVDALKKTGHWK